MRPEVADRTAREQGIEDGSFIELEVTGEVLKLGKSGGMRIGRAGFKAESGISSRHIMEGDPKPTHGPIEVRLVLRGYFRGWLPASIQIDGNGSRSRISVYHIERLTRLDAPTLPDYDDLRASGRGGTDIG